MARQSYQQGVKEKTISSLVKGLLYIGSPQFQNVSKVSMELEVHQRSCEAGSPYESFEQLG